MELPEESFLRIPLFGSSGNAQDRAMQALLYNNLQAQRYTGRGIIEQYCKQNNITLKFNRMDFDQTVAVKMVSVLHILPKQHLPRKIVLGRTSVFSKIFLKASAGKYAFPLFTPTAKDIYLYDNEHETPKEMVHEIGHWVHLEDIKAQKDNFNSRFCINFLDKIFSSPIFRKAGVIFAIIYLFWFLVARTIFILININIQSYLIPIDIIFFIGMIPIFIFVIFSYSLFWLKSSQDFVSIYAKMNVYEDFAETYEWYVMNGDEFRKKTETSQVLKQKYEYMKEFVFDNIEYELDSNGHIVIMSRGSLRDSPGLYPNQLTDIANQGFHQLLFSN